MSMVFNQSQAQQELLDLSAEFTAQSKRFKEGLEIRLEKFAETIKLNEIAQNLSIGADDASFHVYGLQATDSSTAKWVSDLEHQRVCMAIEETTTGMLSGKALCLRPLPGYQHKTTVRADVNIGLAPMSLPAYTTVLKQYSGVHHRLYRGMENVAKLNRDQFRDILDGKL